MHKFFHRCVQVTLLALACVGYSETIMSQTLSDTLRDPVSRRILLYVIRPDTGHTHPCVLFCPRFGGDNPSEYNGLITHMVENGSVVVFPTYETNPFSRRSIETGPRTAEMFSLVSRVVKNTVDTTRVGFIGHSYGAGILPVIAEHVIARGGWGKNGSFLYLMSPWYFPGTSPRLLAHFPASANVVVQVFSGDNINDPRIGSYFFQMLNLPVTQKEFFVVRSPAGPTRVKSDFQVPLSSEAFGGRDDILDTTAIYHIVDSLYKGIFLADSSARSYVCGTGTTRFLTLGSDSDTSFVMIATDNPKPYLSRLPYINAWISPRNPFVEVTPFRKARRMYAGFKRQRVSNTLSYAVDKRRNEKISDDISSDALPNPIETGFGADGPYAVHVDTVIDPRTNLSPAYLFRPDIDTLKQWPVVVLLHGYTGQEYLFFEPYISHLVSRGMVVLYPTYPVLPVASSDSRIAEKIDIVKAGIAILHERFAPYLDTSRVGVQGQSFGGGMVPAIGFHLFSRLHWGENGAYLFMTAPWYCHGISEQELQTFPQQVKMLTMIFDDDRINDHQMAVDIFNAVKLPPTEKNFITLFTDSVNGLVMRADHFVPYGGYYIYGQENYLDYYGVYRFSDALSSYAFYGTSEGKTIAMGDSAELQRFMGKRNDNSLVRLAGITRTPTALRGQTEFFYPWDNQLNPRKDRYQELPDSLMIRLRRTE